MPTHFFPLNDMDSVMERYSLFLIEYKTYPPDSMSIRDFMWHSDRAHSIREERRKAAAEGKVYHG